MSDKKIKVYVGIPTTGTVCDSQTFALRELEKNYGHRIEFVYPEKCVRRIFHDFARNSIVEEFLKTDCDVLWFLDSDICPPKHVLDLVTVHWDKWQVAGAPYPVFMNPSGEKNCQVLFCVYVKGEKGFAPSNIPFAGTALVDGLATGCMFIKREVFEKLSKPYFEFKYDAESRLLTEGEDLGFCHRVSALGYKFFTDFSMVCKHYKTVCLLELNNYAIDYANNSVAAYDRLIRSQVEQLKEMVVSLKRQIPATSPSKSKLILP